MLGELTTYLDEDDCEPSCTKCGSSVLWEDCWNCGGDGELDVYETDPLWYDPGDTEKCDVCSGKGGYYVCISKCDAQAPKARE